MIAIDVDPDEIPDLPALRTVPEVDIEAEAAEVLRRMNGHVEDPIPFKPNLQPIDRPVGGWDVGEQTLDDLPSGAAPAQLIPPFLTPEGTTILYGPGGVGKGYLSLWFALQLVRTNRRVVVIDFETHPGEWGRRSHAMGFTQAERLMVSYRAPFGPAWMADRGSLAQIADVLRTDLDNPERRADYLIIDSYTTATSTGDALGGMAAAQEFFGGIARLGRPALVIAHVAGGQDKWPARPFGSVFVHNLARETWAVEQTSGDESDDIEAGPMSLELRNRKSNGQPRQAPQFFTFTFDKGTVSVSGTEPFAKTLSDMAHGVLVRAVKPMLVKDLAQAIKADEGKAVSEEVLRKTLMRHPNRFRHTEDTPYKWTCRAV